MDDSAPLADKKAAARGALSNRAQEAMERLNAEASQHNIWLRTQANSPAQRPWFRDTDLGQTGQLAAGRVAAGQIKAVPHRWKWAEMSHYLDRIGSLAKEAEIPPTEFADRQQLLLTNPGLGGRLQVANTIRCAMSIYNPGDQATAHMHTPNASRTILSEEGGFTTIEGERCPAERGDLIITPNGTWHDHGNDSDQPVIWLDVLDWPLLEFLDCVWLDANFPGETVANAMVQAPTVAAGYSTRAYGHGGIVPTFLPSQRGVGRGVSPMFRYRGVDIRKTLTDLRGEGGSPYEGVSTRLVNPVTGGPLFLTLDYGAQLIRAGEATRPTRETSSTVYLVMEGQGYSEIGGQTFEWGRNDIFVVPNFAWRRHVNTGSDDVVLYTISDRALMERIGQHRAQGRLADGTVEELPTV